MARKKQLLSPGATPKPPESPAQFWSGEFGTEYTRRNRVQWEERLPFWRHILDVTNSKTFCEVGCNAGWNFHALRKLLGEGFNASGVDLNEPALLEAQQAGFDVERAPGYRVAELFGAGACDLAFTSGVLIHVPPDELLTTMRALRDVSAQYVLAVEYDSPEDREIEYRGHTGKLWKRPFGAIYESLGLSLVEHGEAQGFDQCHYWLLEK